jgi:chloride channel 3/4/5
MYEYICGTLTLFYSLTNWWAILKLVIAVIIKWFLVIITFGIKVPSGLFIPFLYIGALYGHVLGTIVKYIQE